MNHDAFAAAAILLAAAAGWCLIETVLSIRVMVREPSVAKAESPTREDVRTDEWDKLSIDFRHDFQGHHWCLKSPHHGFVAHGPYLTRDAAVISARKFVASLMKINIA